MRALIFLFCLASNIFSSNALAVGIDGIRGGFGFGVSGGKYSESFGTASASVNLQSSLAFQGHLGIAFDPFYVVLAPNIKTGGGFLPGEKSNTGASYVSLFALEAGISGVHSSIPLEGFLGIEYGGLHFSEGTQTYVKGTGYKAGVTYYPFSFPQGGNAGLRFEYKLHSVYIDNYGSVPATSKLSTYFLGVVFEFSTPPAKVEGPI